MNRISIVALNSFLYWEKCLDTLKPFIDGFVVRLDTQDKDSPTEDYVRSFFGKSLVKIIKGGNTKDGYTWREELLRELDVLKPNTVFAFDNDESITYSFKKELLDFESSDKSVIMLLPNMITDNDRKALQYPTKAHCKIFKWQKGMSYLPYSGYAYVNPFSWNPNIAYKTDYLYNHWCFYTKEMEENKIKHASKKYGGL